MEFSCRNCSPLIIPNNCYESLLRTESMWLARYTGQVVSIHIWIPLQIIHDVSVFVPGENHVKFGVIGKYSVEGENIIVFELLD